MANYAWPAAEKRSHIGKRISRIDGPLKVTGAAKYSYDINRPGMLWARILGSPHARAKVTSIDLSAAEALPGVKATWKDDDIVGRELQYVGAIVCAVAAETEEIAAEAVGKIKVEYEVLEHQVVDNDPALSKDRPSNREAGNVAEAFTKADKTIEGEYGIPVITHCCLEAHGQVMEFKDGEMFIWPSTQ